VIIEESHEMINGRVCNRDELWGYALQALTECPAAKVFTFTGTPGTTREEVLLQLELVGGEGAARARTLLGCQL
jgi:hypothetical protein